MRRSISLDALRGYAILTMILSGSIAFGGVLPAWMYHAQVPPPEHTFNPAVPGITWVDLVFPFFLFSMGAAIPLSLSKRIQHESSLRVGGYIVRRAGLIAFLAIFFENTKPFLLGEEFRPALRWWIGLGSFAALVAIYSEWKILRTPLRLFIRLLGFAIAAGLLSIVRFQDRTGFRLERSDIILLVLANVSLAGSFWWWLTRNRPLLRLSILPFLFALLLGNEVVGSWNNLAVGLTPAPWLYQFRFMKYLFIIIPGTFAGEWLQAGMPLEPSGEPPLIHVRELLLSLGLLLMIPLNLVGLFGRYLVTNLLLNLILMGIILWLAKRWVNFESQVGKFCLAGMYCTLLGLFLETFQGGIKKDDATFSYFFLTSGLAFFSLALFSLWERIRFVRSLTKFLASVGQNPLVAYVAPELFIYPIFGIIGVFAAWSTLTGSPFEGVLRGLIVTALVGVGAAALTRVKWFWKT